MKIARRSTRPPWATPVSIFAALFGALTVVSGGVALFGPGSVQIVVGDAVPFVLWFNFLAGFFYVLAGIGLHIWQQWAAILAAVIATTTVCVLIAFGWHVIQGNPFEVRTVLAMLLRSGVWIVIAIVSCRSLGCRAKHGIAA